MNQRGWARIGMIVAGLLGGCGDDGATGGSSVAGGPCEPAAGGRGEAVACVAGALTDTSGAPVVGVRVSACTLMTCIIGPTDERGQYRIQGLPVEPHKIEILGVPQGYMTMAFFQEVKAGEMALPDRDIVMVPLTGAPVALPESGGEAVLAGGVLELAAGDGALVYPIGVPEELEVARVDPEDLPPYDVEPWVGKESKTFAFVVNPFAMAVEGEIELTIKGAGAAPGTPYRLYTADHITGRLEEGGSLVADDAGDLVLQPGATVEDLTTVVIVPN